MNTIQKVIYTWRLLWRNWWRIMLVCILVGGLSIVYIFSIPRSYTSEVVMIPEVSSGNSTAGGLSSLASSIAGVKVGGNSQDAIYPEFYPKVLSTPEFLCAILKQHVTPKGSRSSMTLFDYLTKHQESAWWSKYFSSSESGEATGPEALTPRMNPRRLNKRQTQLVKSLGGAISSFVDKRTDMVTINVIMQDPEVAAQVATMVQEKLQEYIVDYRTSKARNDVEYMEGITEQSQKKYKEAQQKYAHFVDANQDLVLTSMRQEEERLENEMQLAYNAYSQNAQQLQTARDKVQERTPAFTILQAASVPAKPTQPKRVVFVAVMLILSFLASCLWIIGRDVVKRADREKQEKLMESSIPDNEETTKEEELESTEELPEE